MKQQFKVIFLLLLIFGCSKALDNSEIGFTLIGKTKDLADGEPVYLFDGKKNVIYDSTFIKDNKFEFNGELKHSPVMMRIQSSDFMDHRFIWLENKKMEFDASNSDFRSAEVKGSDIQKSFEEFNQTLADIDLKESLKLQIQFIEENPNSIISVAVLSFIFIHIEKTQVGALFDKLSEENKKSIYGEDIRKYIELNKNPQVGEKYVDFEMENTKNKLMRLSNHLGKATLLEFWASWCRPCKMENPNLVKTYKKFKKDGFEIFAVSLDADENDWKKEIEKGGLLWNHVSELNGHNNEAVLIYGVKGIPDNFLLDENGIIVGRNLRGEELDKKVAMLLKSN